MGKQVVADRRAQASEGWELEQLVKLRE